MKVCCGNNNNDGDDVNNNNKNTNNLYLPSKTKNRLHKKNKR